MFVELFTLHYITLHYIISPKIFTLGSVFIYTKIFTLGSVSSPNRTPKYNGYGCAEMRVSIIRVSRETGVYY